MKTADKLLRKNQVLQLFPVSPAKFYAEIKKGTMPAPIKHGSLSFWSENEVLAAIEKMKEQPRRVGTCNANKAA